MLAIDASTVGRRIDALEAALEERLFDRTPDGAVPTAATEDLLPHAEAMERGALALAGQASAIPRGVEGVVQISVPPGIADMVVAPLLPALRARHPLLRIELDSRVGYVDLARREADLALRGMRPEHGDLVCTRITEASSIPFAHVDLAASLGRVRDPSGVPWITYGPDLTHIPDARWVLAVANEASLVLRTSSFTAQVAAVEAGLGATLLPVQLGASRRELAPVAFTRGASAKFLSFPVGQLWLVAHRAMRAVPRVAAVWNFVAESTGELRRS